MQCIDGKLVIIDRMIIVVNAVNSGKSILLQFKEELYPVTEIVVGHRYAAISSYSSQWSRACVMEILPEQKVSCC